MVVFRSIVLFACLLTLTNCSDDSGKLAGPGQDLSRLRKAFTALVSPPPTGPETCLTSLDPCQTSSARPGGAAPQKRSATAASHPVVELAAVQATTGTSSPNVYTIIADAEDFSPLSELVNVLNGDGLRVLPVVGLSALNHLVDITRNGVDLAIVPANAVAFNREVERSSGRQVRYVGRLYDEKLHVLARREITELRQLDGRRVNIGPSGGGAELAAQALFATLGIQPVVTNHHVEIAREKLQTGDIDAAIFLTARPAYEVTGFTPKTLVHLLPVRHDVLEGTAYEPAWLEASQYPALIESGKSIPTVRIANVLAVSDAPQPSPRQKRLSRLVREFYERAERLHRPDQPTAWQEFDPAREVPGWTRFRPAEDWLKRKST
jgi:TRAP-type uncharacterized transport system substrate-binding protein